MSEDWRKEHFLTGTSFVSEERKEERMEGEEKREGRIGRRTLL
jgi:hypothetical protein